LVTVDAPGVSAPLLACELTAGDQRDAARERLAFLLQASDVINASLEINETLGHVAQLLVPRLADWCSIHLIGEDGQLHRAGVHHRDPAKVALAEELMSRQRVNVAGDHPIGEAIRTGRPQMVAEIPRDFILHTAHDERDVELYDALGASSALVAPMVVRGRTLGVLALSLGGAERQYAPDDLVFIELLARRCAVAVDNARLHEQVQDALRRTDESAALVDAIFRAAPAGLGFVDRDMRFARVNDTLAAIHGVAPDDHRGRLIRELLPDLAPLLEPACEKVLATGDPVINIELRGEVAADPGVTRDWLASFYAVPASADEAAGVGIIVQDITDERRAREEVRQRARQQAAVAELGERALRDPDITGLMQDACNVVADTLSVDLAAVLELDDAEGVLRARAVCGWPERYLGRTVAATDETLAGATLRHNRPVITTDVANDTRFVVTDPVREQQIASMISVPIRGTEAGVGVLNAGIRTPRAWSAHDVDFLQAVANVVGAGMARVGAEDELRDERQRLGLAIEAGRMGIWHWDLASGRVGWSETMEAIVGLAPGTFDGSYETYQGFLHPDDQPAIEASVQRAVEDGTPHHVLHRFIHSDGSVRWMEGTGRVTRDAEGRPLAMIGVATDVTEREAAAAERTRLLEAEQVARATAEEAQDRLAFLAEASAVLAESLDYRSVLARVARLAVPRLGDWCSVEVPEEESDDKPFVVAHADPAKVEMAHELRRRYPPLPDAATGLAEVMRTGRSQLMERIDDSLIVATALDEEHLSMLRALEMRSAMLVPLVARGRTIGGLTLVSSDPDRLYDEADLALAEELARRAALAIDNARVYRERSHVARTLQQTLLPPRLPTIPGLQIAARYRFAAEGVEIGGDFYDLFETADGAWAIVIGDACGKGPEAAALTGLARHSLRAAAVREQSPARVLRLLNETILDQVADNRFLTIAYTRLALRDGVARLTVACGGHPAPVIVRAAGGVEQVRAGGTIVGSLPDAEFTEEDAVLRGGDAIVLYTDGVIEARREQEIFGEARLLQLLAGCTGQDARAIANTVRQAVGDFIPGLPRDDMAILVIRVLPAALS
jgi:PAS domain S-box-containing protein